MKRPSHPRRPSLRIPLSYGFGYLRGSVNGGDYAKRVKSPIVWNMSGAFNVLFKFGFFVGIFFHRPLYPQ